MGKMTRFILYNLPEISGQAGANDSHQVVKKVVICELRFVYRFLIMFIFENVASQNMVHNFMVKTFIPVYFFTCTFLIQNWSRVFESKSFSNFSINFFKKSSWNSVISLLGIRPYAIRHKWKHNLFKVSESFFKFKFKFFQKIFDLDVVNTLIIVVNKLKVRKV